MHSLLLFAPGFKLNHVCLAREKITEADRWTGVRHGTLEIIRQLNETQAATEKIHAFMSQANTAQRAMLQTVDDSQRSGSRCYDLLTELRSHQDEVLAEIRGFNQHFTGPRQPPLLIDKNSHHSLVPRSGLDTKSQPTNNKLSPHDCSVYSSTCNSPCTIFETSANFYPEQYTVETQLSGIEANYTSKKAFGLRRGSIYKVCLIYAERPRTWRRLTLSFPYQPARAQVDNFAKLLPTLAIQFSDGVTNISNISVNEQSNLLDEHLLRFSEDEDELLWERASCFASEIDDLGCAQYLESEVVAVSATNGHNFYSLVRGEQYLERKLTFAMDGNDRFSDFYGGFFSNIRSLHILRFSKGVVQLKGVVLDDHRCRVKSYLITGAELGTLGNVLRKCKERSVVIPWSVREQWAQEVVTTMADIHSQNLVVGRHGLWSLVLDQQGHIRRKTVDGNACLRHNGWTAPEVRPHADLTDITMRARMCAKTDLFQLGLELWLLARQEPGYGMDLPKIWCQEAICSFEWRLPGTRCIEEHSDPVGLPPCGDDVPVWYQAIINICRSVRPEDRLAARKLLEMCPPKVSNTLGWTRRFTAWPGNEILANQVPNLNRGSWWKPRGMAVPN